MTVSLESCAAPDKRIPMRDIIASLQQTLHRNHLKILEAARSDWESKYGQTDASDACASIHIAAPVAGRRRRTRTAARSRSRS